MTAEEVQLPTEQSKDCGSGFMLHGHIRNVKVLLNDGPIDLMRSRRREPSSGDSRAWAE